MIAERHHQAQWNGHKLGPVVIAKNGKTITTASNVEVYEKR